MFGSGNIVHNLRAYRWDDRTAPPYDWALRFESWVRKLMTDGHGSKLVDFMEQGDDARLASPTPEHFVPLLYIFGMQGVNEPVSFPVEGIEGGAISMLSVRIG